MVGKGENTVDGNEGTIATYMWKLCKTEIVISIPSSSRWLIRMVPEALHSKLKPGTLSPPTGETTNWPLVTPPHRLRKSLKSSSLPIRNLIEVRSRNPADRSDNNLVATGCERFVGLVDKRRQWHPELSAAVAHVVVEFRLFGELSIFCFTHILGVFG